MNGTKRHEPTIEEFVEGIRNGDRRLLSRAITLVESNRPEHERLAHEILDRCLGDGGNSIRIGVTGAPGAGKSTFIETLGLDILREGQRVAVLAIDPSSARTKGSILGDKSRMEQLAARPEAFIRPSASSGFLGGTAPRTHEAILLCEAAGYDVIIVETVGVGQSEIVVNSMVDFILLLMLPGSGDDLQGIKRGIMEIADLVAVNKADSGRQAIAEISKADFEAALRLLPEKHTGWERNVLLTSALEGSGVSEVWQIVRRFEERMKQNEAWENTRREQLRNLLYTIAEERLKREFYDHQLVRTLQQSIEHQVFEGSLSPFSGALKLLEAFFGEKRSD
ncbi:LAO/AO transport system ATPase [Chlorobaculum parvum NCIB 8327]|uniref:LAO/AO transport system ATPase n=1 Tax=Chlorobaculum parvum (strain DSM 263 / NCIMB 8327) TaxID=517417 RepID=B3QMT9_CHLP8|nr:methylmalonyl Co-A mutase-associated GTPase MeaB [Chlorobaculum parvum]ACF11242.1 LAO/AO transport system ATPase [Chlorobaculum parvum NCIB 8327]